MRKWFKACIILSITGSVTLLIDLFCANQIDAYFGYGRIPFFGYYPNVSLFLLLMIGVIFVLAYFSFLMGAKPVLDRELLGKTTNA